MTVAHLSLSKSAFPEKAGARTPTALLGSKSMRQYQIQDFETDGATCPKCGDEFKGRSGLSKHHAAQHGQKFKPLAACDWCGELYTETVKNLHASERHYCSKGCRSRAHSELQSGEQNPNYSERTAKVCRECGDGFLVTPSGQYRKFCSRECYDDWQSGREWGNSEVEETCEFCGSQFTRYPSEGTGRFCSAECRHEWLASRTGQDHPLWEGGTDWYRAIRSALGPTGWHTQREKYLSDECELCGESDDTLAMHHIVPVLAGGTNADYNYMTLCRGCHSSAENFVNKYSEFDRILVDW
jgi:uncharacterized C2H2 Zn-finger protein